MKLLLLYCTPLAKRLCRLWFMDCRPAGIFLSLSCPASEPTSFFRAVNISSKGSSTVQEYKKRVFRETLAAASKIEDFLKQTYWRQVWRGLKVKSGVRLQYIELCKKVFMVSNPVSRWWLSISTVYNPKMCHFSYCNCCDDIGPSWSTGFTCGKNISFSQDRQNLTFHNIHVIYIFFFSRSTKGDV